MTLATTVDGFGRTRMIGGRYILGRLLGTGASGSVFVAQHAFTGADVALKIIAQAHGPDDDDARARFLREARVAGSLDHESIVRVFDAGLDDSGVAFLAMERLEGMTLEEWLEAHAPSQRELVELMVRVADALGHAHARGLVHRDVKPANVFVVPRPLNRYDLKLLDFGLCRAQTSDRVTRAGFLVGTPLYMSPERALEGEDALRPSADVWSVGAMMYQALTGRPPFSGDTAMEVLQAIVEREPDPLDEDCPDVHPALVGLVARCLNKSPAERPADGRALNVLLRECAEQMDAPTHAPAFAEPAMVLDPQSTDSLRLYCMATDARMPAPPRARLLRRGRAFLCALSLLLLSTHPSPTTAAPPVPVPVFDWAGPPPPRAVAVPTTKKKLRKAMKKKPRRRARVRWK